MYGSCLRENCRRDNQRKVPLMLFILIYFANTETIFPVVLDTVLSLTANLATRPSIGTFPSLSIFFRRQTQLCLIVLRSILISIPLSVNRNCSFSCLLQTQRPVSFFAILVCLTERLSNWMMSLMAFLYCKAQANSCWWYSAAEQSDGSRPRYRQLQRQPLSIDCLSIHCERHRRKEWPIATWQGIYVNLCTWLSKWCTVVCSTV